MTKTGVRELSAKRMASVWHPVVLALAIAVASAGCSKARAEMSAWSEMSRACEAVILDQSFAPLEAYEPAPAFSSGKFGLKEIAVFDVSRDVLAIARVLSDGTWEQCLVREAEEDHRRGWALAADWSEAFPATFPRSEFLWVKNLHPNYVSPYAIRCDSGKYVLSAVGYRGFDFLRKYDRDQRSSFLNGSVFRVFVVRDASKSKRLDELCSEGNSG